MNIRDIASLANVSPATVSKVLNNKDDSISPDTRNRVLKIVRENNYIPRLSINNAGRVASGNLIALYAHLGKSRLAGIEHLEYALSAMGFEVVICSSVNMLVQNAFSGAILLEKCDFPEPIRCAAISCADSEPADGNITYIKKDCYGLGAEAANMCLSRGFLNIGVAFDKEPALERNEFLKGVQSACYDSAAGIKPPMVSYNENFNNLVLNNCEVIICETQDIAQKAFNHIASLKLAAGHDIHILCVTKNDERIFEPSLAYCIIDDEYYWKNVAHALVEKISPEDFCSYKHKLSPFKKTDGKSIGESNVKNKVVVVGSINLDTIMVVPEIGSENKTTVIEFVKTYNGGKGANQATGLAKLGCSPYLIGSIGKDQSGYNILASLKQARINVESIVTDETRSTGQAYITVAKDGASAIHIYSGANNNLSAKQLNSFSFIFARSQYCLISTEINPEAAKQAALLAKEHNARVIVKPSATGFLDKELMENIFLLAPNEKEAENLVPGKSYSEKCDYFLNMGVENIIITLGDRGCYFKNADFEKYYEAADFKAIDTTGGADAFISAITALLLNGEDLDNAIQYATYAAGFCVSRLGVQDSLITKELLDNYINTSKKFSCEQVVETL